ELINRKLFLVASTFVVLTLLNVVLNNEEAIVTICFLFFLSLAYDALSGLLRDMFDDYALKLYKLFKGADLTFLNKKLILRVELNKRFYPVNVSLAFLN